MRIALVGCGYVADFYVKTLVNHPELELLGVTDRDLQKMERFARFHGIATYPTLASLLADKWVDIVVNLTNPGSHYEVSRAALLANKHVYSEKPLAMTIEHALELVEIAESRGLYLSSAPCSILGESAQTLWAALRNQEIGKVRVVYAELDDGPVYQMDYPSWISASGNVWPAADEFEVGCTLEHAGYYVTWLCAFFGPVKSVASFASCVVPDKPDVPRDHHTPDLSVACLTFECGVVARVTCSIIAPHDHRLRIIGDSGIVSIEDCWDYGSPVFLTRRSKLHMKADKYPRAGALLGLGPRPYPLVRRSRFEYRTKGANPMDFARGIAELAQAAVERRPCRLSARFSLHINEVVLAMQHPDELGSPRAIQSTFQPMQPMVWASR